jgi:putative ABC transport system substrate-binding protein
MRRREFLRVLGGAAAAWPLAARAQQQPTHVPQIGWIFPGASAGHPTELAGFKEGLRELGYVEGRNIVVEYRFARIAWNACRNSQPSSHKSTSP